MYNYIAVSQKSKSLHQEWYIIINCDQTMIVTIRVWMPPFKASCHHKMGLSQRWLDLQCMTDPWGNARAKGARLRAQVLPALSTLDNIQWMGRAVVICLLLLASACHKLFLL